MAPAGFLIVDCDSSQIEARVLAWMSGQEDLVSAFEKGEDVYKIMASRIYGKSIGSITNSERFVGKTTILGCGYGMGAVKFKAQLKNFGVDMPLDECKRIIEVYRDTYELIPALWRQAQETLDAMSNNQTTPLGRDEVLSVEGKNGIRLPNGLMLRYPGLRWTLAGDKSEMVYDTKRGKTIVPNRIYGGKCTENFIQALARIVVGQQMLKIARRYRVAMTVHDSVVALVPAEEADEARKYIEQCMRTRPVWASTLPLNCESKIGASYGG
jgi:DNA polymerase